MKTYQSSSSEETKAFGSEFAKRISNFQFPISKTRNAVVIALQGELGAGKTTFTQGFFKGLGVKRRAISPTFVIMRRYRIPRNKGQGIRHKGLNNKSCSLLLAPCADIYHVDAYRLKKAEDLEVLEFDKILSNPQNIILIEWPERVKEILPKTTLWLKFQHGKKENERIIKSSSI